MGLDQMAYTKEKGAEETEDIQSWRKHNALQGWMEALWRTRGNDGVFNCEELELTMHDIEQLEACVVNEELPETQGFFFGGDSRYCEYNKEKDCAFISDAYDALREGKKVFYNCWW